MEQPQDKPEWFRPPNRREHLIAAALFASFGVFFVLMFFVLAHWWFRWVIITLAGYSFLTAIRHYNGARDLRA